MCCTRGDWLNRAVMTEEEIEANAASDPDNPPWTEDDFKNARLVHPRSASKPVIWVHVDEDFRRWVHARSGDGAGRLAVVSRPRDSPPTIQLLRDAKLYEIGAGTSEIRRWLIGRELFEATG
jgi:hypothetical protein